MMWCFDPSQVAVLRRDLGGASEGSRSAERRAERAEGELGKVEASLRRELNLAKAERNLAMAELRALEKNKRKQKQREQPAQPVSTHCVLWGMFVYIGVIVSVCSCMCVV